MSAETDDLLEQVRIVVQEEVAELRRHLDDLLVWVSDEEDYADALLRRVDERRQKAIAERDRKIQRVYFIRAGEDGPIKIGTARDVLSRMRELQCACPVGLRLMGTMLGGYELENALHRRFFRLRLNNGEWFEPRECLIRFIGENANTQDAGRVNEGRRAFALAKERRRMAALDRDIEELGTEEIS